MSAFDLRPSPPVSAAEIALLRTTVKYGQAPDVRQDAEERLLELGIDPRAGKVEDEHIKLTGARGTALIDESPLPPGSPRLVKGGLHD
jgi:hypothetical protein